MGNGGDKRTRFLELLGEESSNFLGTGLSISEFIQLELAEKFATSFAAQDRDERQRRLDAVVPLSIELGKIREQTNFSTGICEMAIATVIDGDWQGAEDCADILSMDDEDEQIRDRHASTFVTFRAILMQTVRGAKIAPS
jgi:hypothetical protein